MKSVQIPGGTAHLREAHELRVRHKRPVEAASVGASSALAKLPDDPEELAAATMVELGLSTEEATALYEIQDATILATLVSWTLDEPIPDATTIGDMRPEVYEALAVATREDGAAMATGVDFDPPDPKSEGFASSPTPPSAVSSNGSGAKRESGSIEPPSTNGTSLPSVEPSPDAATRTT
jgi:hypothetical protein